jgi:aminodeoxychorismate lyase
MDVYLNGRFTPEEHAFISINDRGFLYGDGLFETIRAYEGEPFLWRGHMDRFQLGCRTLDITPPLTPSEILTVCRELLRRNRVQDGMLRIHLSRGAGTRGYSPRSSDQPTFLIATSPAPRGLPPAFKVIISKLELPARDPIGPFKHTNKLCQILARAEADQAAADEAILLDCEGNAVEGTATNLFWIQGTVVCTPPRESVLPGTTRNHIMSLCRKIGIRAKESNIRPQELLRADGVFVTSCAIEIMEVSEIDAKTLKRSPVPARLKAVYRKPASST